MTLKEVDSSIKVIRPFLPTERDRTSYYFNQSLAPIRRLHARNQPPKDNISSLRS